MNLVIGIWEEIKTNIIGDNHVYEKDGKVVKKGLWYNVNKRKKKKISRSKAKSTISSKAYKTS